MKLADAYILAKTKRKTRRIRMALVTIVNSLLFAVLFFGAIVFSGLQQSSARFENFGYNGRNISQASYQGQYEQENFETLQKTLYAQMDTELRARKVRVTADLHNSPEYGAEFSKRISDRFSAASAAKSVEFEKMARQQYNPSAVYHLQLLPALQLLVQTKPDDADPYLTEQKQQAETGASSAKDMGGYKQPPTYFSVEEGMITPLLLPGESFAWQPGQPYPVVMPYNHLQDLAKKSFAGLSGEKKIKGYQDLIKQYGGKTIEYCYRNSTAQTQLTNVLKYNHDVSVDKDPSTKPIAVATCTGFDQKLLKKIGLISDTETTAKPLFPQPNPPAAETRTVSVKIVGFVPTADFMNGDLFGSIFASVANWQGQFPIILPQNVVDQDASLRTQDAAATSPFFSSQLYIDFATRADQKHFIESVSCKGDDCYKGQKWLVTPFGSIKTALESTLHSLASFGKWVVLGIAVLAMVLVLLTISKLISDNRREIAVFRALGARQRDIAQIYFTYGFMLALSAVLVALVLGTIGAIVFSNHFAERYDVGLVQAVGAYQNPGHSILVGYQPSWILGIGLLLIAACMVGVAIPILLSRRRNLVTIMREE